MSLRGKTYGLITKVFGLEEGEFKKAFTLQSILFLLITTLLLIKPTVNSLFLSSLSANALPVGYIVTAIAAVIGAKFYDASLEKFDLFSITINTLYGTLICLIIFGLLFAFGIGSPVLLYSVYVFVAIYGLLVTSQFWLIANTVYNIRQAKRAFGFIGAGGIAGGIFGGYFTSLLASMMPSEYILFVAAFLILCCVPLYRMFLKDEKENSGIISQEKHIESETNGKNPYTIIRESKLLMGITVVIGLSVLIAKLIDYQYSDFAVKKLSNTEQLSSFFGIWLSNISIFSLAIQLLMTERILKFLGVGSSLSIMPSTILLGSAILLFLPELWVVVFIKVVDGSLKQSVDKSSKELMFMPVPLHTKKKTKSFIDVVVDSVATGVAGILLFFLIKAFDLSSAYVSVLIIAILLIEVWMIFRLKKAYRESFRKLANAPTVKNSSPNKEKNDIPYDSIPATIAWIFQNGTDTQILHMLNRTFEYPDPQFSGPLQGLLNHEMDEIRSMSIKSLYHIHDEDISEVIQRYVSDSDPTTATQAMRYLINRKIEGKKELFEQHFFDDNLTVSNASLVGMAKELRNNRHLQSKYKFDNYIKLAVERWQKATDKTVKKEMLIAILLSVGHAKVSKYYKLLGEELTNPDREILFIALKAAARTKDFRFIDLVISKLSNKTMRKQAQFTLFKYGEAVIPELKNRILEGVKDIHDSLFVPEVIERFVNRRAANALEEIAEQGDYATAIAAIQALIRLKEKHGIRTSNRFILRNLKQESKKFRHVVCTIHNLSILNEQIDTSLPEFAAEKEARDGLLKLLKKWLERPNMRIIYLLNLKYPMENLYPMAQVLHYGQLEQKINAAEFLDNTFSIEIRRALMPLVESRIHHTENKFEEMHQSLGCKEMEERECLSLLLDNYNIKIRHAALYLISQLKDPEYIPLVKPQLNNFHFKLQQHARDTQETLKMQLVRV